MWIKEGIETKSYIQSCGVYNVIEMVYEEALGSEVFGEF